MTEKRKNAIVEFQDVVKTYGEGEALQYAENHVSFSVEEGEFVVILGQSGTGKSTVLNMLGSIEQIMFEETNVAEYQVKLSADAQLSGINALNEELDGELVMMNQIEVSKVKNPTADEKKKEVITVTEGKGLYNVLDLDNHAMKLPRG